jgi:hypothetical protein
MLWGDGTADAKGLVGLRHFITATPSTGTTGGIARSTAWWRNRYKTVNTGAAGELVPAIHTEMRQLRRYGGNPTKALAGSDFLDQLIKELRAKGDYTQTGWAKAGTNDISFADVKYKNLVFEYDPTLDDLSLPKRCYFIDPKSIYLYVMENEWGRDHSPARPHNKYELYKAKTYTGQLVCRQLNANMLMEFT